jgi:Cu/Ag efflux protein CusF
MTPLFAIAQPDSTVEVKRGTELATVSGAARVKATVVGIDAATRTVTLKTSKGKVVDLEVGAQARNFDQLKVGDTVNAEYKEALTLSLRKGSGEASVNQSETADRSAPGAKPGGTVGREVRILANVVAVNPQTRKVTVKGPQGNTVDLMVENPDTLKNIKKGDQVEAVYTEALAISVEPAGKK